MKKPLLLTAIVLLFQMTAKAQAPNISYSSQQNYKVGQPITPLTPTNTGGIVPATFGQVSIFGEYGNYGAGLFNPKGIAVDASGNVYIANHGNYRILKITRSGLLTTLAGNGQFGSTDGVGSVASFTGLYGIATDAAGNVYVSDFSKIRKITPAGVVTTLAGNDHGGSTDGIGSAASFVMILGLAVDASGYVYVADTADRKIRKISPAGVVTTLAGSGQYGATDGIGSSASFGNPASVAVDPSGNVYVADGVNKKIRKITPAGIVSTLAGNGMNDAVDGWGTMASINPGPIALDDFGNLYVSGNGVIRKINPAGLVTTLAGKKDDDGRFNYPVGIASLYGYIYILDGNNSAIRKISTLGYEIYPKLPAGLIFDNATGIISGVPEAVSPAETYTITATNSAGVSSATVVIETSSTTLGIENFSNETISVYPNPASTLLQIKTPADLTIDRIQVIDITGKVILEQDSNVNQINVQKLSSGIYFLNAFSENKTYRTKFIKD